MTCQSFRQLASSIHLRLRFMIWKIYNRVNLCLTGLEVGGYSEGVAYCVLSATCGNGCCKFPNPAPLLALNTTFENGLGETNIKTRLKPTVINFD